MTNSPARPPRILAFAGSTRRDSLNKKLIRIAVEGARKAGAEVTLIDLMDFPLPVYDGDLEDASGVPEPALRLKELFKAHTGLLISSPEYNSSIPGGLKNMIDWISRPIEGEKPLEALAGKTATLMSASPGALGGLRGLVPLRMMLGNLRVTVLPDQQAVSKADEAFTESGSLKDPKLQAQIERLGAGLWETMKKLV